jgi:hypothetical protein
MVGREEIQSRVLDEEMSKQRQRRLEESYHALISQKPPTPTLCSLHDPMH